MHAAEVEYKISKKTKVPTFQWKWHEESWFRLIAGGHSYNETLQLNLCGQTCDVERDFAICWLLHILQRKFLTQHNRRKTSTSFYWLLTSTPGYHKKTAKELLRSAWELFLGFYSWKNLFSCARKTIGKDWRNEACLWAWISCGQIVNDSSAEKTRKSSDHFRSNVLLQ